MENNVNRPYKGMMQDVNPVDQPKESYRYALNAVNETDSGNRTLLSNEQGNEECYSLPRGYYRIGKVYTKDNEIVIFSTDGTDSEVGVVRNCEYTALINSECLGFSLEHQIDATYRLRRGCERVIYFTDGINPVRQINLDKLEDYYSDAYIAYLESPVPPFVGEQWNCNKFNLIQDYSVPCFSEIEVGTGGVLEAGSYNFAIQYLNEDLNPTNWIITSRPVNIYHDDIGVYESINGSSQLQYDGLGGSPNPTNKLIKINLSALDPNFTYYRIAVIQATQFTGTVNRCVVSPEIPISQEIFIFDGGLNGYVEISPEEIKLGKIDIETARHIEQLENRLILANIKGKQVNFCEFQPYASKIHSRYIVREIGDTDISESGNPKNPISPNEIVGFMGGEVYAFGIVYVFNDGFESPVYHIPGPSKNQRWNWSTEECDVVDDDSPVTPWNTDIEHLYPDTEVAAYNALPAEQKVEKWRVYETAVAVTPTEGQMAYWECRQSNYENIESCASGDYWGTDVCGNSLTGTPIRHHRFPSRTLVPHVDNDNSINRYYKLVVTIELLGAWPDPGNPVSVDIDYEYNVPPYTPFGPVTLSLEESDFVGGIYTYTVTTELGEDIDDVYDNVTFTFAAHGASFSTSHEVKFAYQNYVNNTTLRLLGVKFTNVEYPHPDIVGHYFVRAERDSFNRTILDSGIAGRARSKPTDSFDYITFSYFTRGNNNTDGHSYLLNPKFLYQRELLVPEYLKYESQFNYRNRVLDKQRYDSQGSFITDVDSIIEIRVQNYSGIVTANGNKNYSKEKIVSMDATAYDDNYEPGNRAYNTSWTNKVQLIKLGTALPSGFNGDTNRDIPYVTLRVERDVHCNLDSIKYYKMHNCMLTNGALTDEYSLYAGDVSITRFNLTNSLYREYFDGFIDSILIGLAIVAATVITVVTAGTGAAVVSAIGALLGATSSSVLLPTIVAVTALVAGTVGVSAVTASALMKAMNETNLDEMVSDNELDGLAFSFTNFVGLANEYLEGIYVESEVNMALRQSVNHSCGKYYRPEIGEDIEEFFRDRWLYWGEENGGTVKRWLFKGLACPDVYHYNVDFSRMDKQKVYFPLPKTYDCCSDCLEQFPDRVYYSEVGFTEELADNYRVFLPNNYRDVEAEHGGITGLVRKGNSLFVFTEECLWLLPQNVQQSVVNEIVTFIGTGEYFSIPPRKMVDADMGSAGTNHKWSILKSPLGIFYVSEYEKSIYLVSGTEGGLAKISGEGMYNWFQEYLKPYLAEQFFQLTGTRFPNTDNPNNPHGIGIHAVFDPRHQRVIFTKRDYQIRPEYILAFKTIDVNVIDVTLVVNKLYFDVSTNRFVRFNGGSNFTVIFLDNSTFFENKSFTVSFSLLTKSWTSFHSYIPLFYAQDQNTFYSAVGEDLWKHNVKGLYQKYYDVLYSHIIETVSVSNPLTTRLWEDIMLQTVARKYNPTHDDYFEQKDVTFNYLTAYNNRQISGELQMIPKDTQLNPQNYFQNQTVNVPGTIVIERAERDWRINDFRDIRIDYTTPMFTKDWTAISSEYPIDKVVNPIAVNVNKDWYEQESFRDKYLIIRLRFSNFEDVELTTNFVIETEHQSFR